MINKKTKKRKKSSRMHGRGRGTHGWGERKKHKKSGHRGGAGMSGSGKRADHKKTLVTKLYGHKYFGKKGITSKKTQRDKRKRINLEDLELNLERYIRKGLAKKTSSGLEINLKDYKILSGSKKHVLKNKLIIKAKEASKSAMEKVKKGGGDIILSKKEEKEDKK
ncbi:MAG TPA: uL15 family ribosomal protein [Bacillota bacterium]|nr:uL15 family ribosomal protein [Bacillota bacterium]